MKHHRSIFGPLLLIAAGGVWLLIQTGSIPASNLWALSHLWPFVLIAAGISIILRSYWKYASLVMDIVIIGGAVFAILDAPKLGWDNPSMISMRNDNSFYVGPTERGSGNVIKQTRETGNFNSITIKYPAQITVTQGLSESVKIEAEDNLLAGLQTRVRGDTLEIFYKEENNKHVNPTKPVKIMVIVKELKDVNFDSAGDLTLAGIKSDDLNISVSGAGNLKVNDVVAKSLSSRSERRSMVAAGETDDFNLTISGFGSFNGKDLHNKTAQIDLSGAGSATIWADEELDAQVSGVGSINYYGSPSVTKQVSGVGSINKLGDK